MVTCVTSFGGYDGAVGYFEELACGDSQNGTEHVALEAAPGGHTTTVSFDTTQVWVVDSLIGYGYWVSEADTQVAPNTDLYHYATITANGLTSVTFAPAQTQSLEDVAGPLRCVFWVIPPLTSFGYVNNFETSYNKNERKGRSVGSQKHLWQTETKRETDLSFDIIPEYAGFWAELDYVMGSTTVFANHVDTRSIEAGLVYGTAEERQLYNMCKTASLTCDISVGEPISIKTNIKSQRPQTSDDTVVYGKSYVDATLQTVGVGPNAGLPNPMTAEPLNFNDASFVFLRYNEESPAAMGGGETTFVTAEIADDIYDETPDYTRAIYVFLDGIQHTVSGYVPGTRTVTWDGAALIGEILVVKYWYQETPENFESASFEINRNTEGRWGIRAGVAGIEPFEYVEKNIDISLNWTQSFTDSNELRHMLNDEYVHAYVTITNPVTAVAQTLRFLYFKLEGPMPPYNPEDIISVEFSGTPQDIIIT